MAEFQSQSLEGSLPPQNLEAEELILGGILMDPEAMGRVVDLIDSKAFYLSAHRDIFQAARVLHSQGKPTDLTTVTSALQDQNLLDKVGGKVKLAQLAERTISAVNIDRYAVLVMEKYLRRQLIAAGHEIVDLGYDGTTDLESVLDQSEQKIFALTGERSQQGLVAIAETLVDTFNQIESLNENIALPGITCGFYDLDAMTSGFQRSDLIIVAGRPSMGKTAFALNIAHNIALEQNLPIAIFSLEMSKEQLAQRLLASSAEIESNRLRSGRITQNEYPLLFNAFETLSNLPIFIEDTPNLTVSQMRSGARRLQAEKGGQLGLVLIDYLQLMEGSGDNRVQELSKITRSLKGLAREINAPVIALSQLSRGVEQRTNKRPMMSDLRESGCLTGESLVYLPDYGYSVPIASLIGQKGFRVMSLNTQTWQTEPATVTNSFCTGVKPVFKMTTALGRSIRATGNHKFLTIKGWKRLDELTAHDYIAAPRSLPNQYMPTMTDAELALLGHLIGDGCVLPRHAIQYTTVEKDLAEIVANLATEVFGDEVTPRIVKEKGHNWYQVFIPTTRKITHGVRNPISQWMDELGIFGLRSYEKSIPRKVFEQPKAAIALFLRHLWSTDGSICKKKVKNGYYPAVYYATSSYDLARNVQSLLLRLDINARLKIVSQGEKGRNQHHVIITGIPDLANFIRIGAVGKYKQDSLNWVTEYVMTHKSNTNRDVIPKHIWRNLVVPAMQDIGMSARKMQVSIGLAYCGTGLYKQNVSRERAAKVAQVVQSDELKKLARSDVYWDKVTSIETDGEETVYDLTVLPNHNFICMDIYTHNSIEQDADLILMLYRDAYYNSDSPDRDIAEIIITKHRNGPTGTVKLIFNPQFTKFRNLQTRQQY